MRVSITAGCLEFSFWLGGWDPEILSSRDSILIIVSYTLLSSEKLSQGYRPISRMAGS